MIDYFSADRRGGNMLEKLPNNRTEYSIRWVNVNRSEVHAFRYVDGERVTVGCCFRGSERACRLYVGQKIGGLELVNGRLVHKRPQVIPQPAPKLTAVRKLLTGS
jgi:hypothetical protein